MHILMVPSWYPETSTDFGGSFFREQAETLARAGHTVGVLSARVFPIYQLPGFRAYPGPRMADEAGVTVARCRALAPIPRFSSLNNASMLRSLRSLYDAYVADHGVPDVLHAHSMFPAGIATRDLSRAVGVPFVITEHRPSSIERLNEPGHRKLAQRAVRDAGGLVAVSAGFAKDLNTAYGLDAGGWQFVPGLLSPQFQDAAVRDIPDAPFTFGHVSHLDIGKRVDLLIGAFADAFPEDDTVRLRIAGGTAAAIAPLAEIARAEGVVDRVDFVGAVAREEIVQEFSNSHVFALVSEAEAFGTVLWEAMAVGIPVLVTDTWAGQNVAVAGVGTVVARDDRAAIAAGLVAMRREFPPQPAETIRKMSLAHCGADAFVAQYVEIYRGALV